MNANKIINTIVLVFFTAAAVTKFVWSNYSDVFLSGWVLGICFVLALIFWAEDL